MKNLRNSLTISAWINLLADDLIKQGKRRTSVTYRATLKSFIVFNKGKDMKLKLLNANTIQAYESYLFGKGLVPNSVSFYMRILRAAYNKAADQDLVPTQNLFKHVYTGVSKTTKRAIPLSDIKRIKSMRLKRHSPVAFARDMFMFSFYTRGMSFVDMAHLRKDSIRNGYLTYRRQKTGQLLQIKWEPCMAEIVQKYETKSIYLLPIITHRSQDSYCEYQSKLSVVNRQLKVIANRIGINTPLSMYVARHSWATGAKEADVPISVISDAMGHDSETTTRIYLASMSTSRIDEANERVLKFIQ